MSQDIETAIVTRMRGFTGIGDVVGTRIYPDIAPEKAAYPFLTYQLISDNEIQGLEGSHGLLHPRITIKCFDTKSADTVRSVISRTRKCWVGFRGTVDGVPIHNVIFEGRQSGFDEQAKAWWRSIDLEFWYGDDIPTF